MKIVRTGLLLAGVVCFFLSCKKDNVEEPAVVITATGNIQDDIDRFRELLGGPVNTTTGLTTGRREINWEGVPDSLTGKSLPLNFFNPTEAGAPVARQRGLSYLAGNGEFRVSNSNFTELNPGASGQLAAFSGTKIFANISNSQWPIGFQVAGQTTEASVRGFGAVFTDVDMDNSTSMEFFNGSRSIGTYFVPPHDATSSFSFLGVYFKNEERITKVLIGHKGFLKGGQADVSNSGADDLIALDDFLYSEPLAK
jgi:hypothetical protein